MKRSWRRLAKKAQNGDDENFPKATNSCKLLIYLVAGLDLNQRPLGYEGRKPSVSTRKQGTVVTL